MSVERGHVSAGNFYAKLIWKLIIFLFMFSIIGAEEDVWKNLQCDKYMKPPNCEYSLFYQPYVTVEDYDRCAPAYLQLQARNYFLGWTGRGVTYRDNRDAFKRLKIIPQSLRDTSRTSLETSVLGQTISFPIGFAPTGYMNLAVLKKDGQEAVQREGEAELAIARVAMDEGNVMILSSYTSTSMEEIAANVNIREGVFWMQTYVFRNRFITLDIVRRAERLGFKAIVFTADANIEPRALCNARNEVTKTRMPNDQGDEAGFNPAVATFEDITWLKYHTFLPVVAKGILTGEDATKAIMAGASALIVSTHGGRQLDGVPASIDALPEVVEARDKLNENVEVYLDGGIRNGFSVYKALARGAKMVFVGRPTVWGLTVQGEYGVRNVIGILRSEFNETMILAGATSPSRIQSRSVVCASCRNYVY